MDRQVEDGEALGGPADGGQALGAPAQGGQALGRKAPGELAPDAPTNDDHAAELYLALLAIDGIGPATVADLIDSFGTVFNFAAGDAPEAAAPDSAQERLLGEPAAPQSRPRGPGARLQLGRGRLELDELRSLLHANLAAARRTLAAARSGGLEVLTREDAGYPPALRSGTTDPPPLLFTLGTLPAGLLRPLPRLAGLAVVGRRKATSYALSFARDLARSLARSGVTVVSGLALGVDGAAHQGALEGVEEGMVEAASLAREDGQSGVGEPTEVTGGTVAVLGGGHGHLHPASHRGLGERIVKSGGAVISEWPPDVKPRPYHFLQRNRVISGLSRAVAVIEAGARSGALNTAAHALEQGRAVLAVPGRPDNPAAAGALALLRDGATPLIDPSDALALFTELPAAQAALLAAAGGREGRASKPPAGSQAAALLAAAGEQGELEPAAAAEASGNPVATILAELTKLELQGHVERLSNGRFRARKWR